MPSYKRAEDLYQVPLLDYFSCQDTPCTQHPTAASPAPHAQPLQPPRPLLRGHSLSSAPVMATKPFRGSGASLGFALSLTLQIYGFARQPESKGSFFITFLNKIQ